MPSLSPLEQMPASFGFNHMLSHFHTPFSVHVRDTHCGCEKSGEWQKSRVGKAGVWLRSLPFRALRNKASVEWARCQGFADVSKTCGLFKDVLNGGGTSLKCLMKYALFAKYSNVLLPGIINYT